MEALSEFKGDKPQIQLYEKDFKEEKGGEDRKNNISLYMLFSLFDPIDIVLMILGAIAALLNGLSVPLTTYLFGQLVDTFGGTAHSNNVVQEISKVSLRFVYLGTGTAVATFFQMACWMVTGERQSARIRNMYLKALLRQDITFFDKETDMGEVVGRMSGDVVLIQDAMGEKVGKFIQLISTFVGGFVVAFLRGWILVLVLMSMVPLLVLSGAAMSMVVNKLATREQAAYSEAASLIEQIIGSIKTVASFTGEREAINRYNRSLDSSYESSIQEGLAAGLGIGLVMFIIFCSYGLATRIGSLMIIKESYTGGDVVNIIFAVIFCSMCLGQVSPCVKAFAAGKAAALTMFETINRKPDIDSLNDGGRKLDDICGDIELKDVYFNYPTRPYEQIFAGFSLCITSGLTAALVGESGSGKSTVISLIERFYDPQGGEVLIDGINLKEFQLRWIREKIGLVGQEPVLFACSIKDNIAYGKDNATMEEIKAAAELANAAIFIDKLPQGLETMVGDYGTQLSGGQKQRVAIARAVLRNPRILLLDEATSALDAESERSVQEALDRIMTNRTTITVAHRLSTVRNADLIAVIHRGKLVEKGSHNELVHLNGTYSRLISFNTWAYMKFTKGFSADAKMMYEEATQVANDAVRNIRTVASFCAEEKVMSLYRNRCKAPKEAGIKLGLISGALFGISFIFLYASYAITFYLGSQLVQHGKATFVEVFRVFFALCMAAMAVSMAGSLTPDATKAKACTASVFAILDRKSEIDSSDNTGITIENIRGEIEFQHVSFTYPTRPDVQILRDLNLAVQCGKMVALVGESGCGKSTIISLLQRFYDPTSGEIMLDGTDIKKFQLRWMRQQIGLVSQEPLLFNDTIRANIAYGKEGEATEAEIFAAAGAANAHEFISAMNQGYDTLVGERGVQLSGGQKQRVAIARAILKAPKILLLDEATSALDTESERVVQAALEQVMVGRTTIVVAHRLSTIKGADLIAVMKYGAIVEQGKHENLINIKDGYYASLTAIHMTAS
ncbi:Abc transporter b family protein [Thalictrum thalictroides]|uniref:Abc transporter b family protein n=1 Tax=Thalictrum thalictroides TaxID=46969 RepID=A0A7J6WTL6_THATH|nr:Abc transporter b family protein [Thalictrum thalictroides]